MKRMIIKILIIAGLLYLVICGLLYFMQEKLIFYPQVLDRNYRFGFDQPFEEMTMTTNDNSRLHGLLFKADSSKGLIFYLHGNGGALDSWGEVARTYTDLNYDVFLLDYRGYGKSEGVIYSQKQFFDDVQTAYDSLKNRYAEDRIVVLGYSIGTGAATKLASANNPKLLILQAPYYSLTDMMRHTYPIIPTFILKYKFETSKYLKACKMPVVIFHGDVDEVIYYGSSLKLRTMFKKQDTLITLEGQAHNGITDNVVYRRELQRILSNPTTPL
ncbi:MULTISPECIES: alpha/beta hydrolase [Niastella]|uniref:Alpha/beta fold hydrolase n=1 Tax=Niastella soli TaxID=2821487 RepID=A0ABS3YUS0_9BACT|nr:alpha/beta hydrolase [Niastella soli]MBO9201282.1 alpha/beta fold hydrolase [Niastella soli]